MKTFDEMFNHGCGIRDEWKAGLAELDNLRADLATVTAERDELRKDAEDAWIAVAQHKVRLGRTERERNESRSRVAELEKLLRDNAVQWSKEVAEILAPPVAAQVEQGAVEGVRVFSNDTGTWAVLPDWTVLSLTVRPPIKWEAGLCVSRSADEFHKVYPEIPELDRNTALSILAAHPLPDAAPPAANAVKHEHELTRAWDAPGTGSPIRVEIRGGKAMYYSKHTGWGPSICGVDNIESFGKHTPITDPARLASIRAAWDAWKAKQATPAAQPERYWVEVCICETEPTCKVIRRWRWLELKPEAFVSLGELGKKECEK